MPSSARAASVSGAGLGGLRGSPLSLDLVIRFLLPRVIPHRIRPQHARRAFNLAGHIAPREPDADRKRSDDRRFGQIILAAEEAHEPIHDLSWCLLIDVVTSR